jgi:hypothetical protein
VRRVVEDRSQAAVSNNGLTSHPKRKVIVPRQVPACIPATQPAAYSSSVCSCLNIPTPTITTTFYYTLPPSATQTVTITPIQQYTVITTLYDGSTTATSTVPSAVPGQTGTIFVQVPRQYATVSTFYTGTGTVTTTIFTPTTLGQTGQVLVQIPQPYTTTTSYYAGSVMSTSTIAPTVSQTQPATVVVYSPQQYTTTTSYYAGSVVSTSTIAPSVGQAQPATVIVYSPQLYTTTTSYYTGSVLATSTIAPTAGQTQLVTVVIYSPQQYTTTTSYYAGSVVSTSTIAPSVGQAQPATVIVYSPQLYTTTTSYYTGSVLATSTIAPTAGQTQPATIVVYSPQQYITTTSYYAGSVATTSTFAPATAGQTGTVVVYSPLQYTTVTTVYNGVVTTTTTQPQASPGPTNTVLVQVPMQYTTVTTTGSDSIRTTSTQFTPTVVGQTGTVLVLLPRLNTITTTTGGVGFTSTSTTTVSGSPSQVAVVGVPITPFHVYITTLSNDPIGYLDVGATGRIGTAYSANVTDYASSSLFYYDSATGQLALSPSSGISAQPLYSLQQSLNGPFLFDTNPVNTLPINANSYPDGIMALVSRGNGAYTFAILCNGILYLANGVLPNCIQVSLNPTYDAVNYTTTTITTGTVAATRTFGPNGNTVSSGGTVTQIVPVPTCTASGLAYTAYPNPFTFALAANYINPDYVGFNSSYYNGLPTSSILFSGTTNNINYYLALGFGPLYGSTVARNVTNTAILYRGYFMPPTSGTYGLVFSNVDDIGYFWMGTTVASSTWGELNYQGRSTFGAPRRGGVQQAFVAGNLYPIVVLTANGVGDAGMQLSILTPAGVNVTDTTGYFLQPSCVNSGIPSGTAQPSVTTCAPRGVEFYNRPAPPGTVYEPNFYNPPTASPYSTLRFQGFTRDTNFSVVAPATSVQIYGEGPYDLTNSVTILRGYFTANVTGSHTFTLNYPDDLGYLWLGANAINTWTSANAVIRGVSQNTAPGTYTATLTAGDLTPIRLAYFNGNGDIRYPLSLTDPTGLVKYNTFGFFRQAWCGGVTQYSSWT